jgi:hypothetical protein
MGRQRNVAQENSTDQARARLIAFEARPKAAQSTNTLGDVLRVEDLALANTPRNWVCKALGIAPGRPAIFAGYGGRGKSWALETLMLSVASGVPLLGEDVPVRQGSVVYLSAEQDLRECSYRLQCIAMAADIDLAELIRSGELAVVAFPKAKFDRPEEFLRTWSGLLTEGEVALCGIDSLVAMSPGLDGNADEISNGLRVLAELSGKTGTAFVLTAHENKTNLDRWGAGERETALKGSASVLAASSCVWSFFSEPGATEISLTNTRCMVGPIRKPLTLHLDLSALGDVPGPARVTIGTAEDAEPKATRAKPEPMRVSLESGWRPMAEFFEPRQNKPMLEREIKAGLKTWLRKQDEYKRVKDGNISEIANAWLEGFISEGWLQTVGKKLRLSDESLEQRHVKLAQCRIVELVKKSGPISESALKEPLTASHKARFDVTIAELVAARRLVRVEISSKGQARKHPLSGFDLGPAEKPS